MKFLCKKLLFVFSAAAAFCCGFPSLSAQQNVSEGITITKDAKQQNPTLIYQPVSGDAALNTQLLRSFRCCGWFDLVRSGSNADYVISGTGNANSVTLTISNSAGVELGKVSASGANVYDTAHAAVDAVLKNLFRIDGICRSQIVFTVQTAKGNKELMVCDFDGQRPRQITKNGALSLDPTWSPDNRFILYSLTGKFGVSIIQYDVATGLSRKLTNYKGLNAGGVLSPNGGKYIALVLARDNQVDLYMRSTDGGELKRLTRNATVEASPCWTPDGRRICFVSDSTGRPLLYLIDPFSASPKATMIRGLSGSERVTPCWSKDGKLTYSAKIGRDYVVAVADMNGDSPEMLQVGLPGQNPVVGEGPTWAPDNRHIAVSNNGAIYIVDTRLGRTRKLFSSGSKVAQPDWSALQK